MRAALVLLLVACRDPSPPPAPAPVTPLHRDAAVEPGPARPSVAPVTQLVVGRVHTCALHGDRTVSCWGDNSEHQLGPVAPVEADRPVPLPGVHDAVELAAFGDATCLRRFDRTVACWGAITPTSVVDAVSTLPITDVVQLKDHCLRTAAEVYCLAPTAQLVRIADLRDAIDVAGSPEHGCAVRATGQVVCWRDSTALIPIGDLTSAVQVAVGDSFGCARLRGGTAVCWPWRARQRFRFRHLAPPSEGEEVVDPAVISAVPTVVDARDLVAGGDLACARGATGLACWDEYHPPLTPVTGAVTAVAVGSHSCAARSGRDVVCWGPGASGELGGGWSARRTTPIEVPGISDAIQVWTLAERGGSAAVSCALHRTGTVSCWGDGPGEGATPAPVPNLHAIVALGTGDQLAALDREQHVWRGTSAPVRLHLPPILQATSACAVMTDHRLGCGEHFADPEGHSLGDMDLAPGFQHVVEVSTMSDTCARLEDGRVQCAQVAAVGPTGGGAITDAIGLATGDLASCLVRSDHTVWCWGMSDSPLFGGTGASHRLDAVRLAPLAEVAAVAIGVDFACARHLDGGVSCWGINAMGQLGDGSTTARSTPARIVGLTGVVQVATGTDFACAVHATGKVACWGSTLRGQVGSYAMTNVTAPMAVAW